jgi:class III poly(R)-hydroxyalkanoic acid synthase PhaE subunit
MSQQDPQAWMQNWLTAQRELWEKLVAGGAPAPPPPPGPEQFMQLFGASLPESSRDVAWKLMAFGEGYLGVAREFWKVIQDVSAAAPGEATDERLRRDLDQLRHTFTQGFSQVYGSLPLGAEMLSAWQKLGAAMPGAPGAAAIPPLPAFGLTRERQEALQRLGTAAARYQQALLRFSERLGKVAGEAVDRLARRIATRQKEAEPLGSLRAVHDLWVECGEEAYAAAAHGPEFARAQAELTDALVTLRGEQQKMVEDWARSLDLPTRSEVNTLIKRVNTLRRRLREVEEELDQLRRGR